MSANLLAATMARPERCCELSSSEWEILLGQARRALLVGRLAEQSQAGGWFDRLPVAPRRHLIGARRMVDRQRTQVRWEVACIERALARVDTPVVLLKGAAYDLAGLTPARGRLYEDVDIMVRRERLDEVEGALFAAGWLASERDAYNERYYRQWMHELPPLTNVRRNTALDVHHTITPPTSRFRVDANALFARALPVKGTTNLFVLSPCDMVLHSAVHLFQEGEFGHGLRDLLDMHDLLSQFADDPAFPEALIARAGEIGLGQPLYHALSQLERLLPGAIPTALSGPAARWRPGWPMKGLMFHLFSRALRPEHPTCDDLRTRIARFVLYVRAHYLRMPLHLLLPHLIRKAYVRRFPKKAPITQDA